MDGLAGLAVEADLHLPGRDLAGGERVGDLFVVAADVADAELAHGAVAALHLAGGPFERGDRLGGLGDDGGEGGWGMPS